MDLLDLRVSQAKSEPRCDHHVTVIAWGVAMKAATAVRFPLSKIYAVDESHDWAIVCPSHNMYGR